MARKKALITGIAGQDGSYLAELLLVKGYEVHGSVISLEKSLDRIEHVKGKISLHECDATDKNAVGELVKKVYPDEIYHLAAIATASVAPETEYTILNGNLLGIHNILMAARKFSPKSKIFFAGSSLIFGIPKSSPQDENTPINPNTPYGIAKAAGYFLVKMYREHYGVFGCTGILFNHESPRRSTEYVPKKITSSAVKIKNGSLDKLEVGNLGAVRDWGYAGDYVEAMWLMLQKEKPEDYVIASGEPHTVRELIETAFDFLGIKIKWEGEGTEERGVGPEGKVLVKVNPKFFRPVDQISPIGNSEKIRKELNWKSEVKFPELIKMMLDSDLKDKLL
jgi:GDPmannose 4,6-dehydratase